MIPFIGIPDAFGERALVIAAGENEPSLLAHDDGRAVILAHRQDAARHDVRVLEEIEGDELSFAVASVSSRILASWARWAGHSRWLMSLIACSARSRSASRSTRRNACGPKV